MSEVLRLVCKEKPDIILILTEDNAFDVEVQEDEKGEFIILPPEIKPTRKNRKVRLLK